MPHASATENSVFSNGFSLLTLKKPITFAHDPREVKIVMTLAAKDGETHTAVAIPQIIAVFCIVNTLNNFNDFFVTFGTSNFVDVVRIFKYS
ncbi:PTS sugar transporter subunit IIA, partial [Mycoplasmopsis bovis]|uniref:PTS sugar transporter subunit IIA n=1 Tax=Mycoplasmopsis bovis TaxID=28903 RepID=UPI003D2D059D